MIDTHSLLKMICIPVAKANDVPISYSSELTQFAICPRFSRISITKTSFACACVTVFSICAIRKTTTIVQMWISTFIHQLQSLAGSHNWKLITYLHENFELSSLPDQLLYQTL